MFGWFKKKASRPISPDFSAVDTKEKAEEMFRRGKLEKLFLIPPEFGGQDNNLNYVFVPLGVASLKARMDNNVIAPLIAAGKVTKYNAAPEYQGKCHVPISIKITASEPGDFTTAINIWGDALGRG